MSFKKSEVLVVMRIEDPKEKKHWDWVNKDRDAHIKYKGKDRGRKHKVSTREAEAGGSL